MTEPNIIIRHHKNSIEAAGKNTIIANREEL